MAPSAQQAFDGAVDGEGTIGWKLRRDQRKALLARFPPEYPNIVADHVTLRTDTGGDSALPQENEAEVVGKADDGRGVEALVVRLGGTTDRPDGSTYHITWSLADGREAKESNDVIAEQGWVALDEPVPIRLEPARWP